MKRIVVILTVLTLSMSMVFAAVSRQEAERIAINDAGVDRAERIRTERDRDDGRIIWEVDFYADGVEYEYDIDEATGVVIKSEFEIRRWRDEGGMLSDSEAIDIAIMDSGEIEENLSRLRVHDDYDDGKMVYEVSFVSDRAYYSYDISLDGRIVARTIRYIPDVDAISIEQASDIALARVKGATPDDLSIKRFVDGFRVIYAGAIHHDDHRYDFRIDGATGRIVDFERNRIRH